MFFPKRMGKCKDYALRDIAVAAESAARRSILVRSAIVSKNKDADKCVHSRARVHEGL